MVPKKSTAYATQTMVIRMSMGHSASAYSLLWVMPRGRVIATSTMTSCQPQKVKAASLSLISLTPQVRCTTYSDVPIKPQPPKAKITALVCNGRSRLKVRYGRSRLS